jgi:hypothetical protein
MGTTASNSPSQSSPSQTKPQQNPAPGQKPPQTQNPQGGHQNPQGGKPAADRDPGRSAKGGADGIANVGQGEDSMGDSGNKNRT